MNQATIKELYWNHGVITNKQPADEDFCGQIFFSVSTKFILLDVICITLGKYIRYLLLNLNPNVSYMTNCLFYELTVEHGVEVGAGGGQESGLSHPLFCRHPQVISLFIFSHFIFI